MTRAISASVVVRPSEKRTTLSRLVPREPERQQRGRRRERAAGAGAPHGDGDPLEVEPDQKGLARRPFEEDGRRVRAGAARRRRRRGSPERLEDAALETVAQRRDRPPHPPASAPAPAGPPPRSPRSRGCSPSPPAAASPARRPECAPRASRRVARRARRRPWARASCGPRPRAGRRRGPRRRPGSGRRPGPRRRERARPGGGLPRRGRPIGYTPPYSLLAAITETRTVPGPTAASRRSGSRVARGLGVDRHDLERARRREPRRRLAHRRVLRARDDDRGPRRPGRAAPKIARRSTPCRPRSGRSPRGARRAAARRPPGPLRRFAALSVLRRGRRRHFRGQPRPPVHDRPDLRIERCRGVVVEVNHGFRFSDAFKLSLRKPLLSKNFSRGIAVLRSGVKIDIR